MAFGLNLSDHEPCDLFQPNHLLVAVAGAWENGLGVTGNHDIYSEHSQNNTNLNLLSSL